MVRGLPGRTSSKKEAKNKLQDEKRQRYVDGINLMRKFAGIVDRKGNLQFASEAAIEGLGYTDDDVLKKPFWDASWFALSSESQSAVKNSVLEALGGENVRCEVQAFTKDGTALPVTFNIGPLRGKEGEVVSIVAEAESVIEESPIDAGIEELRKSEERLLSVFELIQEAYFEADNKDRFTVISSSGAELLGYESPDDLIGKNMAQFWESPRKRSKFVKELQEEGKIQGYEALLLRQDGTQVVVEVDIHLLYDSNGNISGSEGIFRDITEKKEREQRIKTEVETEIWDKVMEVGELENKFANFYGVLVEQANDGIGILQDGVVKFANPKLLEMGGYQSLDEVEGMELAPLLSSESADLMLERYTPSQLGEGIASISDMEFISKDGRTVRVEVNGTVIEYDGKPAVMFIMRDITDRKPVEESERMYAAMVENANDGIGVLQDGILKYANPKLVEFAGYHNLRDLVGKRLDELVNPETQAVAEERIAQRMAGKPVTGSREIELVTVTGESVPIDINGALVEYEGKPAALFIIRDITDRVRMETELRQSQSKYSMLVEQWSDGVIVIDKSFDVVFANEKILEMTGFTREDLAEIRERDGNASQMLMMVISASGPVVGQEITERFMKMVAGEDVTPGALRELILGRKDGTSFPAEISTALIEWDGERAFVVIIHDITTRKHQEEARREAEARYKAIFENDLQLAFVNDPYGHFMEVNHIFLQNLGYAEEDVVDLTYDDVIHPDDLASALESVKQALLGEYMVPRELRMLAKSGDTIWVNVVLMAIEREGIPYAVLCIAQDIGDRKQAEEAVAESEQQYRGLFDSSPQSIVVMGLDGVVMDCNRAAEISAGVSREELIGKSIFEMEIASDQEISKHMDLLPRLMSGEEIDPIELRLVSPDGEARWREMFPSPWRRGGEINGIQLISHDITGRKQAEEELRLSEERLKDLVRRLRLSQEELSTPVIQVWDRVLALPLIGVFDTGRAQRVMEVLLSKIVETQSEMVIVDVTGVAAMDTEVTNHLIRTVQSTALLGAKCVITGINPDVAQAMSQLGLDMTKITTKRDMQDGLKHGLRTMGWDLRARQMS